MDEGEHAPNGTDPGDTDESPTTDSETVSPSSTDNQSPRDPPTDQTTPDDLDMTPSNPGDSHSTDSRPGDSPPTDSTEPEPPTDETSDSADTTASEEAVAAQSRYRSSPGVDLDGVVFDDDDDNQGLFDDLLAGEPIFENKEVLRPSYTPHELPHRTDQINRMATILVSALRGETPSNILIYGKTGTGKTASAKFVSQELESTSKKYDVPCEVEYINCEVTDTQYRVLAQLANTFIEKNQAVIDGRLGRLRELASTADDDPSALESSAFTSLEELTETIERLEADAEEMEPVPMTGWPTDRVYTTFFDAVDYHERVVVIMLDEIDKLVEKSGDDTLYNLSRINSALANSRLSIMGISNDLKFTDFLDPRVKSSLG